MTLFSSPFDETAVDLLEGLGAPAYKIASFEAVDLPLIALRGGAGQAADHLHRHGQPGRDRGGAETAALEAGAAGVVLLHCVSSYPAALDDANVRTVADMARAVRRAPIGLSDHTPARPPRWRRWRWAPA